MNPWMEERAVRARIRRSLPRVRAICDALNLTAMNLTITQPVIPVKNILLLEAFHDSIMCPKEDTEDLWQVVGTARHLAVAARTRRRLLWVRAGFAGARPALAGTAIE
jgi:hypothetical protein